MRKLTLNEIEEVNGGDVKPLIDNPQSGTGQTINDVHEAYVNFLNEYVFPLIYQS